MAHLAADWNGSGSADLRAHFGAAARACRAGSGRRYGWATYGVTTVAGSQTPRDDRNLSRKLLAHASADPFDAVDRFDPVQDRAMHQSPGRGIVRQRSMHHTAVVPHEQIADLPFVVVDDLPARGVGGQLLDKGATLGCGHVRDVINGHAEDERLAAGLMAP